MTNTDTPPSGRTGRALRAEAGEYLQGLREAAGVTQLDVAKAIGVDYYTLVSQVERGVTRLPPAKMADWAKALRIRNKVAFAKRLLKSYDPATWTMIYGTPKKR